MNSKLHNGILSLIFICSFGIIPSAQAFAIYCENCSTIWDQASQIGNQVKQISNQADQIANQINQYNEMVKQGLALPDKVFGSITSSMDSLRNVYQSGRSLAHSAADLDQQFRQQFKGYKSYLEEIEQTGYNENMPANWRKWAETGFDNARTALLAVGMQTGAFADEDAVLQTLVDRSATAQGRMQAIQAGNEIAAQQVQQLQKLREMIATSVTLQANYVAQQTERQAVQDATIEFRNTSVKNSQAAMNKEY